MWFKVKTGFFIYKYADMRGDPYEHTTIYHYNIIYLLYLLPNLPYYYRYLIYITK